MGPSDRNLTTLTSHFGLYRFLRMLFGLKNFPATFQHVMGIGLSSVFQMLFLAYLHDGIIFSKSIENHFEHLDDVLQLLRHAQVSQRLENVSYSPTRCNIGVMSFFSER